MCDAALLADGVEAMAGGERRAVSTESGKRGLEVGNDGGDGEGLVDGGRLTAAMASQISDGASAVLLASEQAVKDHGLTPRARIHHISARGADPVFMLTGPIPATRYALDKAGLTIEDIDTVEINEAFAPVVQAWLKETKADPEKVNPSGGAIALGHPLGATGAKLFATMLNTLERTGGRYGPVSGFIVPTLKKIGLYSERTADQFKQMWTETQGAEAAKRYANSNVDLPGDLERWVNEGL